MNIEKTVRKALFSEPKKVELSSEKVELGIADDFAKIIKEANSLEKEIDSSENKSKKTISNLKKTQSEISELKKEYLSNKKEISFIAKSLSKAFDTLYKQAKELGIDLAKVPAYQDYLSAKKILDNSSEKNQDFWSELAKYI